MRRIVGIVVAVAAVGLIAYVWLSAGPDVPQGGVLVMELGGSLSDAPPTDALAQYLAPGPALPTLVLQLDKAGADSRLAGVLLRIRPLSAGFAQIQELRDAVSRVREAGKTVVALLEVANLNATRELYLAAAADQIYVAPGYLGPVAGIAGEFLHLGGFLAKLGILVEYERIGDYKSAPETFAETSMSAPARENANALLDGLFGQVVRGIASGRDLSPGEVRKLVDAAPGTADEIVAAGLADGVASREEALERAGWKDAPQVDLASYFQVPPQDVSLRNGPAVAIVFGEGAIVSGEGGRRSRGFAVERIVRALEAAAEHEDVRAIVLRVDSPGGSSMAADRLWRVIERISQERPVVVSMGNAAASAGYYVASAADAVVAEPATMTGSIGVFLLRPSLQGLYAKLDIDAEIIARGPIAGIGASAEPFTESQRSRARDFIRSVYEDFVERVAAGRDLTPEQVDRLGQGRIWLGETAFANDLVDAVGGLHTAVALAKERAGIDPDTDPQRMIFPGPRSLPEQIRDIVRGDLREWLVAELWPSALPELLPVLRESPVAYLPPFWLEFD